MTVQTKEKETKEPTQTKDLIFINNIKINNDGTARIYYRTSNDKSAKEVYYNGKEPITEEFAKAFQGAREGFCGVIPALAKDISKITMNVIKFDYDKTDFLNKALYSVKYAFNDANNAVVNISTPMLPIYNESFDEHTFCISGKHETALHEIIALAKKYMNGETRTRQMKLVVDND